jgi:tagaturonate epimerase
MSMRTTSGSRRCIGTPAPEEAVALFRERHPEIVGRLTVPGISEPLESSPAALERSAGRYLAAVRQAGKIYRQIAARKGEGTFVTEVSMDETESPQTPYDLLVILAALADESIPVQTIAPKFTGQFLKGVDYLGDTAQFEREFRNDLAIVDFAATQYGLPPNLKLSIHSGSDKFSIYSGIAGALKMFNAGLHLKTAGTTWLEELAGIAACSDRGLDLAQHIYSQAFARREELCAPYRDVVALDPLRLPHSTDVRTWTGDRYVAALRHDPANPSYNPHFRQLLHVAYKIAAENGTRFLEMLAEARAPVSAAVTMNLFEKHVRPLFCP